MQCPECKSTHVNKNGKKKGKQNYICVNCRRQFLDSYQTHRGHSNELKRECLMMYFNGMSLRAIGRIKGVSHVSILNWVRQVGELLPNAYEPEVTPQVGELDELQTPTHLESIRVVWRRPPDKGRTRRLRLHDQN